MVPRISTVRTAAPFWGRTSQMLNSLSPKRDCGTKRVRVVYVGSTPPLNYSRRVQPRHGLRFVLCLPLSERTAVAFDTITGDHSKWDQILLAKIGENIRFCLYRRSYLLCPPRNTRQTFPAIPPCNDFCLVLSVLLFGFCSPVAGVIGSSQLSNAGPRSSIRVCRAVVLGLLAIHGLSALATADASSKVFTSCAIGLRRVRAGMAVSGCVVAYAKPESWTRLVVAQLLW